MTEYLSSINHERYDYDVEVSLEDIQKALKASRMAGELNLFEFGLYPYRGKDWVRFDCIKVDTNKRYIRIFEIKTSRNDFTRDNKWRNYLDYCHSFTWVSPYEMIKREEIDPVCGLGYVIKRKYKTPLHKTPFWSKKESSWHLKFLWVKRPKKMIMDESHLNDIAWKLLNRFIYRSDEF